MFGLINAVWDIIDGIFQMCTLSGNPTCTPIFPRPWR